MARGLRFQTKCVEEQCSSSSKRGLYCFLDGDCLANPEFIANHRKLAEPGFLLRVIEF